MIIEMSILINWKSYQREKKNHVRFAQKKEDAQKKIGKEKSRTICKEGCHSQCFSEYKCAQSLVLVN